MNNNSLYPDNRAVVNECMTQVMYALEGRTLNVFFDEILECCFDVNNPPPDYRIAVTCTKGRLYDNRWTYTPLTADVGTTTWKLQVFYQEIVIKTINATLITLSKALGNGVTRKIMFIGDSITAYGYMPAELINIFNVNEDSPTPGGSPDVMTIDMIGTVKTNRPDAMGVSRTVYHECRNSWKLSDYVETSGIYTEPTDGVPNGFLTNWKFDNFTKVDLNESTDGSTGGTLYYNLTKSGTTITIDLFKDIPKTDKVASGTREGDGNLTFSPEAGYGLTGSLDVVYKGDTSGTWRVNPFFRNGVLDFTKYMSDNSLALGDDDRIFIMLGVNDVTRLTDDTTLYAALTQYKINCDTFIRNIRLYNANIKIAFLIPPAGDPTQDAWGDVFSMNTQTARRYTRNRHKLAQSLISFLRTTTLVDIYEMPYHINFDIINNYPQEITQVDEYNVSSIMIGTDNRHPSPAGFYQLASILKANIKSFEA